MYTGTLIRDLIAMVDRAERKLEQERVDEELHAIFAMHIEITESQYLGAA